MKPNLEQLVLDALADAMDRVDSQPENRSFWLGQEAALGKVYEWIVEEEEEDAKHPTVVEGT